MIKNYPQVSPTYGSTATSSPASKTGTTSAEILSSFKQIFSTMMMSNGLTSPDSQSGGGMSDIMAPMMMMLLEKMLSQQLEQGSSGADTNQAASGVASGLTNQNISQVNTPEPMGRPVQGVLTQDFHPGHNGLDFGIVVGTPIKSTMDGKVTYAGWNDQGYGNLVIVENGPYRTYFGHLSSIPVAVGDSVNAGTTIGLSGNTGHSTGPHLHYEIRKNNIPIDPTAVTLGVSG